MYGNTCEVELMEKFTEFKEKKIQEIKTDIEYYKRKLDEAKMQLTIYEV
jgi:hypothetical protein